MTDNFSDGAKALLANFEEHECQQFVTKAKTVEATIATWNNFNAQHGSFTNETFDPLIVQFNCFKQQHISTR